MSALAAALAALQRFDLRRRLRPEELRSLERGARRLAKACARALAAAGEG